jgi:hypothetical protein
VRDELDQVRAVDRGVPEAVPVPEPVRVQAPTADVHHRAGTTLGRQGIDADLPRHRRRVVERVVEAARHDVKAEVGGAWIGRAERVELLDGAIGVDDDQRARQQPEPLHLTREAEYELDELAEQPDPGLLPRRRVPAIEDPDQPFRVPAARRDRRPVSVRQ